MEKVKTENDLTTRQWALYRLIKRVYKSDPTKYLSNRAIYRAMKEDYPPLNSVSAWNNQAARRYITEDLAAIRRSKIPHLIILSTPRGSKIATKKEVIELEKLRTSLLKSLKTVNAQLGKVKLDGQKRLVLNQEKEYIDTFLKEEAV